MKKCEEEEKRRRGDGPRKSEAPQKMAGTGRKAKTVERSYLDDLLRPI